MRPDRFVFRRRMLVLVFLLIVEIAYLVAAGFPSETHVVPLAGTWQWEILMLMAALVAGGFGPFAVALAFTVARLVLLLGRPVHRTTTRGLKLRTVIARM